MRCLLLLLALPAQAQHQGFVAAEGHASILSDAKDTSTLASTFGWQLRGGWRWGRWGGFVQVEQNMWLSSEVSSELVDGAWNVGVGGELLSADGFVRTAIAAGPSILAFDTTLDGAGSTGFFLDARPVGLRWRPHPELVLGMDPITFAAVAPVLDGIPLARLQYRSVFYGEFGFL